MVSSLARRLLPLAERLVEKLRVIGDDEPPPIVFGWRELLASDLRDLLSAARDAPLLAVTAGDRMFGTSFRVRGHDVECKARVEYGTLGMYREMHVVVESPTASPALIEAVATRVLPNWTDREWQGDALHVWAPEPWPLDPDVQIKEAAR